MANTKAAEKDIRQTKKRTARNLTRKRLVKELTKEAMAAIESGAANAGELVAKAQKALDKAGQSNAIHQNKANRLKARLQRAVSKKK